MPPEPSLPWICSQLGAREHYAIPRALHRSGRLLEFHTDLWSSGPWRAARFFGAGGRDLAGRFHPGLRGARVHAYPVEGVFRAIQTRFASTGRRSEAELRHGRWLDGEVQRHRSRRTRAIFFSYTGTFLGTARALRNEGALRILGQIDPASVEEAIVAEERTRRPGWEMEPAVIHESFREHRRAEWEEADLIVVNSAWSEQALLQQDVPARKLRVVPLAYEPPLAPPLPRQPNPTLRVLWLGQVILRKGIGYLLDAARLLFGAPVEFTVAGGLGISEEIVAAAPSNVRFLGPVSRSQVSDLYARHDVFVLPTLSDGFAITQLEAMAHGLPVIATPRCGAVVVDGSNGRIIPPKDATALAAILTHWMTDRDLVRGLAAEAVLTSHRFGLDRLTESLLGLEAYS